ncbi:MAG TPA: TRAP transporter large permease subunit [Syntrophorhabdaceae bacterium]|nr:TRAP transporter large permease subunit [Syntrophorhabdaceae bacterium]
MSPEILGLLGFVCIFALLALGMPIGAALGLVGFAGMTLLYPIQGALIKMATTPVEIISSYSFAVMPLFVLMAQVTFTCGFGADLFKLASKWLGHYKGGLAMASIGGSAGFGACSGSALITAATVSPIALPEMKKYNYDTKLAVGACAAGGTIGSLIPPSTMFIIYGILTGASIGKLFCASLIPAFLTVLSYLLTIYIICKRNPNAGPPAPAAPLKERFSTLKDCWEILVLLVIVIGGMIYGLFTPTDSGAIGAFGAILLGFMKKRLTWRKLWQAAMETMKIAGVMFTILIGAMIFNFFCAKTGLPQLAGEWVLSLHVDPWAVVGVIVIIYFFLGMVMEAPSIQILTIPVFYPIIVTILGYDPIWFGVVQVRMLEITGITPPLGMIAYIMAGANKDVSIGTVFRGAMPFLLMELITLPIFIFVKPITLWLPSLMK